MATTEENKQNFDWIETRREFDSITNVDEIFYFLEKLVHELNICSNVECKIFPELDSLDKSRYMFKEIKDIKDAEEKLIKDKIKFTKFERDYENYIFQSKNTINKIFRLKSTTDTAKEIQNEKDQKFKEYLQICAKYGLTPELEIQKGLKDVANAYGGASLPLTKDEKSDKLRLEEHIRKISEKEKKKKENDQKENEE